MMTGFDPIQPYLINCPISILYWLTVISNAIFKPLPELPDNKWVYIEDLPSYEKGNEQNRTILYVNRGEPLEGEVTQYYVSTYVDPDAEWCDYMYMTNVPVGVVACLCSVNCVSAWMYEDGTIEWAENDNGFFERIKNPFPEPFSRQPILSLLG